MRRLPHIPTWLVAGLGYVALTVLLTWPTVMRLGARVAGFAGRDSLQYTWSLWWASYAWRRGQSIADVNLLYHPWGGQHPLLGVTPQLEWLAFPLESWLTPTQVYNVLFLLSFPLSGLAMYALARELRRSPLAAFFAGALFAFFPNRMGHALSGHLTQLASWWLPLYIWALLRLMRKPRWSSAVLTGVLLALSLTVSLVQTAYAVLPVTGLLLVEGVVAYRRSLTRARITRLTGALLLGALLVLPFYGPLFWTVARTGLSLEAPGVGIYSVDLMGVVVPSPYHPLWGGIVRRWDLARRLIPEANDLERIAFVGFIPLGLALVGYLGDRRTNRRWLWLWVGSLILSWGPVLKVAGRATGWPLPYALLMRLPFFGWGRTPERFSQLAMLGIAVLAAAGLDGLRCRGWFKGGLVALALVEVLVLWPFPEGTPAPPAELALVSGPGAVLDLPISKRQIGNLAMFYQTTHRKPIVGGYIHRDLPGMRAYVKALDAVLSASRQGADRPPSADEVWGLLAGLNVSHVVVHRQFVKPSSFDRLSGSMAIALGAPLVDTGQELIFRVSRLEVGQIPVATFDGKLALLDVQAVRSGGTITVALVWQALDALDRDYTVFVHVLDEADQRVAQHDGMPVGGNWPTRFWAPGETVVDEHTLDSTELLPGFYDLGIGWYRSDTGARLEVEGGALVEVGMLRVPRAISIGSP